MTTAWPGVLLQWNFDPTVVAGVILAAVLYARGWRRLAVVRGARSAPNGKWQAVAFYAGLAIVVVALESPIDGLSAYLFTFHMMQHLLLIMVAAPLLLLGDPGVTTMRGMPLVARRQVLGALARLSWIHRVGAALSFLIRPQSVFLIFVFDLYVWHWNGLFNLTLQNDTVHLLEHLCFLVTALLFWGQVIDQRAVHGQLSYLHRAIYLVFTAAAGNVLAMYFVFAPKALYAHYAQPVARLYGMTPISDQQIAGALMWVPVLFLFGGAAIICLYKALAEDEQQTTTLAAPASYSMPFERP